MAVLKTNFEKTSFTNLVMRDSINVDANVIKEVGTYRYIDGTQ